MKILIVVFYAFFLLGSIQAQAEEKVTVILDWFLNASHESLLAAQYSGAFKRHGLTVELVAPADPAIPPRLVAAGQADIAITYPLELGIMVDHHIPLIRIGSLLNQPMNVLLTNKNIASIQDLKGKKIGVSITGDDNAILKTMLAKTNVQLSDIQIVNVNFQLEQALMTGAVDAIIGAARNYEMLDLEQRYFPFHAFKPEDYGVPSYDEMIFVTRPELLKDSRIIRFLMALKEGNAYLQRHPDVVFSATIKEHPEFDTALNRKAWQVTLPMVPSDPAYMDVKRYQAFLDFLWQKKIVHQQVMVPDFSVNLLP